MSAVRSVAVIGAGMAGAAAAHRLAAAGLDVLVVDKGRNAGGRMATRLLGDTASADHGAQYFTARDPRFTAQTETWVAAGAAAAWTAGTGWFVGTPAMTSPVRNLLRDIAVLTGHAVGRLHHEAGVWRLDGADGAPVAPGRQFDAILMTAPAPQAVALLATAGIVLPALARVRYAPCWALMLACDGPPSLTDPVRHDPDPGAALAWIARNETKPGRPGQPATLVAHASPDWSRRHLERDRGAVADLLRAELARVIGAPLSPSAASAHRWRYALVEEALGEPCLWQPEIGLGFAGDGCLGGRVEAAYLSGLALAERVLGHA